MVILIALVIIWTSYVFMKLLRDQHAGTRRAVQPQTACARPPGGSQTQTITDDGSAWSALDDRQLTRLLIDTAPRSTTEKVQRP